LLVRNEPNDLGGYIKEVRKSHKLTLQQLSQDINYSMGYLSRVELNKVAHPSPLFIQRLAARLGLDPVDLAQRAPEHSRGDELLPVVASEMAADRRSADLVRGADARDLQFLQAQLRLLRAYQSGDDLTQATRDVFDRVNARSERVDNVYLELADLYIRLGEEVCWRDAGETMLRLRLQDAIASYRLAEAICERLAGSPPASDDAGADLLSPRLRSVLIRTRYKLARAFQDLASLNPHSRDEKNARLVSANEAINYCNIIIADAKRIANINPAALQDDELALWPAALAVSAYMYSKILIELGEEGPDDKSLTDYTAAVTARKSPESILLHERQEALQAAVFAYRTDAEERYKKWIDILKDRAGSPERDDMLATAYFRLALLFRGREISKVRARSVTDFRDAVDYFHKALESRRQIAQKNGNIQFLQRRDLARYHREFGLALQYSEDQERYARVGWQYRVAGMIDSDFDPAKSSRMSDLMTVVRETVSSPLVRAAADQQIKTLLACSDFEALKYPLDYTEGAGFLTKFGNVAKEEAR